jgi:hypothetical protein
MSRQERRQEQAVDERQERVGRNEALFRVLNEQLEGLNDTFSVQTGTFDIVCECGNGECVEQLTISTDDYAHIRRDPTLFVLVSGHQDLTSEAVVEEQGTYVVVRKYEGGPAELAAERASGG